MMIGSLLPRYSLRMNPLTEVGTSFFLMMVQGASPEFTGMLDKKIPIMDS